MRPTKEQLLPFINNYKEGLKEFSVSERTFKRWLAFYGLFCPTKNYGPHKLNFKTANKIRKLESNGYTQKELAKMFNVTQATIGRIINNIYYKINLHLKGKAEIKYYGN